MSLFSFFSLMCVCQPSLTLCNTMDCSPPGSSVHGIFQARVLEWVAISFSRGSSQLRIEPAALKSLALAGGSFTTSATWEAPLCPCRSFQSIEYSSLHSDAVGPCWLSFWYTAVCIWEKARLKRQQQGVYINPNLLIYSPHFFALVTRSLFSISVSLFLFWK